MWKEALPPLKHETVFIFFVQIIQLIYLNLGVRVSLLNASFPSYFMQEGNKSPCLLMESFPTNYKCSAEMEGLHFSAFPGKLGAHAQKGQLSKWTQRKGNGRCVHIPAKYCRIKEPVISLTTLYRRLQKRHNTSWKKSKRDSLTTDQNSRLTSCQHVCTVWGNHIMEFWLCIVSGD